MVTPQFLNIGASSAVELQSIVPVGDSIDTDGGVYIQTLDFAGRDVATYQWIDWGGDDVGWMDGDYSLVEGVAFEPGAGLWVTALTTDDGLQTAGAVGKADVTVQLRQGATATGNPFPTSLALQDIVPVGESIDTDGGVYIQVLDFAGRDVATYQWIDWGGDDVGWMDGDYSLVEGVSFEPGAGLWVTAISTDDYLRFPAPEL